MKLTTPLTAGTFFSHQQGYIMLVRDLKACELTLGSQYSTSHMLSVWDVNLEGEHVGFFFYSPYKTENKGACLLAFMESKRGKAESATLIIRNAELLVYEIPGCGAMALSTKLSPEMEAIIQEQ